uniref:Gag protein n=1 Tax=Ditylenchus dipsaci TaxID=166011 RepID=A0A915DGE3_9BILA
MVHLPGQTAANASIQPSTGGAHRMQLKLPKLKMPTFGGDPLEWPTFWQSFQPSVDSQPIPSVQKLTYLLGCLKDDALKAVTGFAVTNENYQLVLGVLQNRFGCQSTIVDSLQAQLITLPLATESHHSLRNTAEAIDRICRQLSEMGQDENNSLITMTIKSKLTKSVLTELVKQEHASGGKWSTLQWRNGLQQCVAIREEVHRSSIAIKSPQEPKAQQARNQGSAQAFKSKFSQRDQVAEQSRSFPVTSSTKASKNFGDKLKERKNQPRTCFLCEKGQHWWQSVQPFGVGRTA